LSAPELLGTSPVSGLHIPQVTPPADGTAPFTGALGNQADASIYQPASKSLVGNSMDVVMNLVNSSTTQPNYYAVSSASAILAGNYGTSTTPALVVINDPAGLSIGTGQSLSGYGVLMVNTPNTGIDISGTLNWTGIVIVNSATGHVTVTSGATGFINGVLLVRPGAAINLQNTTNSSQNPIPFKLTYSCEAIDLPFSSRPFRIISSSETSF
jgi:hypothetical protein